MSIASHKNQPQTVALHYLQWEDKFRTEKPYVLLAQAPEGFPTINYTNAPEPEQVVEDLRGREKNFSLDSHGFAVRSYDFGPESVDFGDSDKAVETVYLPHVRQILQNEFGPAAEAVIFDWRIRSGDKRKTDYDPSGYVNLADPHLYLAPVLGAHVDQTPAAAKKRIIHHLPGRGQELLSQKRCRIVNVWRPLSTVHDFPLAVCDGSTVRPEDLVGVDSVRTSYVGESWHPVYRDYYRWYYLSEQSPSEALLIKMFDSDENVNARYCPHTSFKIPGVLNPPPRESIEVRAMVFS